MLTRLLEMLAEALRELVVGSLLLELGEGLHQRLLGVQNVAKLVQEQLARIIHLSTHQFSCVGKGGGRPSGASWAHSCAG